MSILVQSVMHVEDDQDIQELAKLALELVGHLKVHQFSSGQDAIENARNCRPDLLLLDQMMPNMSGEETLTKLRKFPHLADVPAIFMTAQSRESSRKLMKTTDAVGVIYKPFDPMKLTDQINEIVSTRCPRQSFE